MMKTSIGLLINNKINNKSNTKTINNLKLFDYLCIDG